MSGAALQDMYWKDATPDPPQDIHRPWFAYLKDFEFQISLHKLAKVPVWCTESGCKRNSKVSFLLGHY